MMRRYPAVPLTPEQLAGVQLGASAETLTRRFIRDHGGAAAAEMLEGSYPTLGRAFVRKVYRKMLDAGEISGKADAIKPEPPKMPDAPTTAPAPVLQYKD